MNFNASLKFEDSIFAPTILKICLRISTRAFLFRMYWSVEINKTHRNRVESERYISERNSIFHKFSRWHLWISSELPPILQKWNQIICAAQRLGDLCGVVSAHVRARKERC